MTKDHRINVPVDQEMFDSVNDMAALMEVSSAHLVRELLATALPALQQVTESVSEFKAKEAEYLEEWQKMQERANQEFSSAITSMFPPPPPRKPTRSRKTSA